MECGVATQSTNEEEIRPRSHSTQKKRNTNAVKCTETVKARQFQHKRTVVKQTPKKRLRMPR